MGSIEFVDPQMAEIYQAMFHTLFYVSVLGGSLIVAIVIAVNPVLQKIVFGIVLVGMSFLIGASLFEHGVDSRMGAAILTAAFVIILYDILHWCRCRS